LLQNGMLHFAIRASLSLEIQLESNIYADKNWLFWKGLGTWGVKQCSLYWIRCFVFVLSLTAS